ncbi:alpha/beta hydrolase [Janthinobacterium aquaticum]|uniref:alpha/beta hydrolase n=1 Tax=Janthinobacterium sp. FT58W TaxID=2654254 RepID=UPI0012656FE5|nr:alpha/beta hydrolase [Janthinobacterium sp. FT58W]KAB8045197.1 alpha/beta hydrolase fold domain-containing protein [Janthinobacterium sp. FT58W]
MKRLPWKRLLWLALAGIVLPASAMPGGAIALWPGAPPGGAAAGPQQTTAKGSITDVAMPYLVAHRAASPNAMVVLVISGGGYAHIEAGKESAPAAAWLQAHGISAYELVYRLPVEGGGVAAPFQDAQRAMRLLRSHAGDWGIDPKRIGIMGFSAGAHLAGITATQPGVARYAPVDASDSVSARPDFAVLLYPVLTMQAPFDTTHAKKILLGPAPSQPQRDALSVERQVDAQTPPTFIAQALDDAVAAPDNSLLMLAALRRNSVPAELHLFQRGGHGWGMGKAGSEAAAWPLLLQQWLAGLPHD